jgi:DNA-3-methyladenine glycosylase I
MKDKKRCDWSIYGADDLMILYHDKEWGKPIHNDKKLFEALVLDSFQAGLSWRTILNKRENFRKAFSDFDFNKVAMYTKKDFNRLMKNKGIIRNKLKIEATIVNAKKFLEIRRQFKTFDKYIWQFTKGKTIHNKWRRMKQIPARTKLSDEVSLDLKKHGFKFVGSTSIYAMMQGVGIVNDHVISCFRHKELRLKVKR